MTPQELLRRAEADAERFSAIVRLVIFLVLATAEALVGALLQPVSTPAVLLGAYGLGTGLGLLLAWRGVFHPLIAYGFVSFDVALITAQLFLIGREMSMPMTSVFATPLAGLIFVVLIHASMRYRPWLVIYAAGLLLAAITVEERVIGMAPQRPGMMMVRGDSMEHDSMEHIVQFGILPAAVVGLAALVLFLSGLRVRALLFDGIEQTRRAERLSRFFSPNVAQRLATGAGGSELEGHRQPATVLFVDIRGFTGLGETMTPEALGAFLTDYRNRLTQPIFRYGGTVDKFIGDAIMAVFGVPTPGSGDSARAVRCALDILAITRDWSEERRSAGEPSVAVGIGVHHGEVFAGALGNEQLLEYTVIGDTVNVAERLERLSREVDSALVLSGAVLAAAPEIRDFARWRRLSPQILRGHQQAVEVFCLETDA